MEKFFNTCHETEERLLRAVAVGLGLDETHFDDKLTDRVNEFRLTHYPPVRKSDINLKSGNQTRTSEHTDFGTITLLFQDSVGGLEVESHEEQGVFHPITAAAPTMVINIGIFLLNGRDVFLDGFADDKQAIRCRGGQMTASDRRFTALLSP